MKIELEPGVWLADGEGDPARTLVEKEALNFGHMKDAMKALAEARKFRPFEKAQIHDDFLI